MKIARRFLYGIFGLILSLVLLLTSIELVAFDINHYMKEYEKHGVSQATGMDRKNLHTVSSELLSYLRDKRDNLKIEAMVKGERREVFGEREKLHMVDVKDLFLQGRKIRNMGFMAGGLILLFLVFSDKSWKISLGKTLKGILMVNVGLFTILAFLVYFDFRRYFDYFHYIFFDNDLWILNPKTDIMIQMLPQGFFYNTAIKIAGYYIVGIIVLSIIGGYHIKEDNG